ncbi:MAG: diaminopimelate epimerase [Burkholderiaceae bacterium]
MKLRFTKMHGAGNDFVVIDATKVRIELSEAQCRVLGDRRLGVGADQILVVEPSATPGVDFRYRIYNNSGDEVEHCGNGARCFMHFVRDRGLTDKRVLRVQTVNNLLELRLQDDGRVTVDMNAPVFDLARIPFDASGLTPHRVNGLELWPLGGTGLGPHPIEVAVLSMGNPHAVQIVGDVEAAAVAELGPRIESHVRFPRKVNAGFMQIVARDCIRLRVHERGAGETLACGSGACAAVVAGIRLGRLDARVDVHTRGGVLTIEWQGAASPVLMTGPAISVYEGEIEL